MKKWLIIILICMLLVGGGTIAVYIQLIPRIKEYGTMEVQRFNQLIVSHCYFTDESQYKDLVVIERGSDNTIELLDFDMIKVNQLSTKIAQDIETTYAQIEEGTFKAKDDSYYQRRMQEVSENGILSKVSVMSLLHIPIFQFISPSITIKYNHLSSVSTSIVKSIKNYGVNHVMVELSIEVNMKLSMVYPFFEQFQTHKIKIPVLLEIFQGQVPLIYSQ
ncbi:MAG: sporulation protein YunB [Coprobacillus sp.]